MIGMERYFKKRDLLLESSQFVKGVGPSRQVYLERLGIKTVEDLLLHFPRKYYDRSHIFPIGKIEPGVEVTFVSTILAASLRRTRRGQSILTVVVGDETGRVELIFFNQPYLENKFRPGERIVVSGVVSIYANSRQMISPEYELFSGDLDDSLIHTGRIVPVYPLTSGISQRMMRKIIANALEKCRGNVKENLSSRIILECGFPPREEAFRQIHYPDNEESSKRALERFKFEEIFFLHMLLKKRKTEVFSNRTRPAVPPPHDMFERFVESLPFSLTDSQRKVLDEIVKNVESSRGLNMLVQGDVGSGKTVVAVAAMVLAVEKGFQAAMMVPTEILAEQHYERVKAYLQDFPVRVELLIGSMSNSEKHKIREGLAEGLIDMIIGTHALIQEEITFKQLGLAVIDEQHRFGVKQRATLGSGEILPHFLVLTATPIPRSLAQTVYGDLDLSVIEGFPAGRRDVVTEIVMPDRREDVYGKIEEAFRDGKQAFILYPVIEDSGDSKLLAAIEQFEYLQMKRFKDYPLGLLHGRMSYEEKKRAVEMFRRKEIVALVTTTVIEVGIDVPGANILVVNNPERFGLSQLHQLRGRIGRSGEKAFCYLMLSEETGAGSLERLRIFASTNDGFKVAEEDLRLRGPGEIWGYRQSGYPSFKLINPLVDSDLVARSWEEVTAMLAADPGLKSKENRVVAEYYYNYYKPRMELAEIG